MKPPLRSVAALFAACGLVSAADSTRESRDSLLARGDFNGDGRADLTAVDHVTGIVRIAHAQAGGALVSSEGHKTGIAPATGMAVGKFLATTREALAVTSTTANRTNLLNLSNLASLPVPLSVSTPATGSSGVSAARFVNGTTLKAIVIHYTQNGTSHASAFGPNPARGRMLRSIRPTFTAPPGVTVFRRIGGGWVSLAAQAPGWQLQELTIRGFGRGAGDATTPVYQAACTFAEPADTLDSDDDGVPDVFEITRGIDPLLSGDGAGDLLELLTDRSPTSDADFPTRANNPPWAIAEFDEKYQNAVGRGSRRCCKPSAALAA